MKDLLFRALCALALALPTIATPAQDEPLPEESAKTPRSFADLMPEKGEPLPEPFWMVMEMSSEEGRDPRPADGGKQYFGWSITKQKDGYVTRLRMGDPSSHSDAIWTYGLDGKLKSYQQQNASKYSTRSVVGKFDSDKWVLTRKYTYPSGKREPHESKKVYDAALLQKAIPFDLAPVVMAYHARNASLGYAFKMMHAGHIGELLSVEVEDVGTEKVKIDGKERTAHVLVIKMSEDEDREQSRRRDRDQTMRMTSRFLDTGEMVDMTLRGMGMVMKVKRATAEEIAKDFGLDDTGLGPKLSKPQIKPEDPDNDEAPKEAANDAADAAPAEAVE